MTAVNQVATMHGQAVAQKPQKKPIDLLKSVVSAESIQQQFKNALGNHKDAFIASLIELVSSDTSLQECPAGLLVSEALRAATLRLPLNKGLGFAYIVPFNTRNAKGEYIKTPNFIVGYKGYIQLAMRTGQYKTLNADVVYEGELQSTNKLSGEINLNGQKTSETIIGYFAHIELLNGFQKTLYMSVEEMANYAKRFSKTLSKANVNDLIANAKAGIIKQGLVGWYGDFSAMAIKTVLRRLLSKYGYLSVEMQTALIKDNEADTTETTTEEKQTIDVDNVNFEEVNTNTGEVEQKPQQQPVGQMTIEQAPEQAGF